MQALLLCCHAGLRDKDAVRLCGSMKVLAEDSNLGGCLDTQSVLLDMLA